MRLTLTTLAALITFGCGRTEVVRYSVEPPDAAVDAGLPDAGPPDAGPPDAGPPDAGPCIPRPLPLEPAVPTAMFVIDRSGSMEEDLDGRYDAGVTRWRVLETALRTVLPPLDRQLAMGALMYPHRTFVCSAPSAIDLSPALGNSSGLLALFGGPDPVGGTPISEALSMASQHLLSLRTATAARALILATDGAPNCNSSLNNNGCVCTSVPTQNPPNCDAATHCLDDVRTISTLRAILGRQVPTYVIGLGSSLNQFAGTLDQMAVAGGVPRQGVGPRYYSVANQAELTDAFGRITSQLTRCTFLLNGLGANDTFVLLVGGVEVPRGPNGWEWLDEANRELALTGAACDLAAGGAAASVLVDCH